MFNILRQQNKWTPQGTTSYFLRPAARYYLSASAFGLVEVIIGVSVLAVSVVVLFSVILFSQRIAAEATTKIQVALLLQEGAEAMRYYRSNGSWSDDILLKGTGALFCFGTSNVPKYELWNTGNPNCINTIPFTRTVSMLCAVRSSNDITSFASCTGGGASLDTDTIKSTITVTWNHRDGSQRSEQLETILTNR